MVQFKEISNNASDDSVFPRPFRHGGFIPPYEGEVHGDKALMGGLMRRDIDPMGGGLDLTLVIQLLLL